MHLSNICHGFGAIRLTRCRHCVLQQQTLNGGVVLTEDLRLNSSTLQLRAIRKLQAGRYICSVSKTLGEPVKAHADVTVLGTSSLATADSYVA